VRRAIPLRSVVLLAALGTILVGPSPQARGQVVSNEFVSLSFSVTNPCNGEEVLFSGKQHIVFFEGRPSHFHSNFGQLTGVGTSGTVYTATQATTSFTIFNQSPQAVGAEVGRISFVTRSGESDWVFQVLFHVTDTATGERTVSILNVTDECRG
jgi:hypothetical protein